MGYADPEKKYENYNIYDGYYYLTSINYSWKIKDTTLNRQSGEYSYNGLAKGSANTITGTCTISATEKDHYDRTEVRWEYIDNEIIGYEKDEITGEDKIDEITGQKIPIYKEPYYKMNSTTIEDIESKVGERTRSADATLTVYTHPGTFEGYNFSSGTIIQSTEGLSATKVSNWCTHAGKYLSWKYQENKYGTVNCNVNSSDLITAEWYNKCAVAVDSSLSVNTGDLITADAFIKLGAAISP